MIRIQVTHYNGAPPPQPLFAEFNESGGNIGRAEGNALVLHDPTRTISRTHASIINRDGDYAIRNLGTATPVYINGQPLGNGRVAAVAVGDEIRIGSYTMKVLAEQKPGAYVSPGPSITSKDDPLALFREQQSGEQESRRNPLADLLAPSTARHPQGGPSAQEASAGAGSAPIIPPDFDPFATTPSPESPLNASEGQPGVPEALETPEAQEALNLGFGPSIPSPDIDELFGLDKEKGSDLFSSGPPSLLMPGPDQVRPPVDPLVALHAAAEHKPSTAQAQRDDVPELHGSFRPPEAKPDIGTHEKPPERPQAPAATPSAPYGMVLSWESRESGRGEGEITSIIVPSPVQERRKAERRCSVQPQPALDEQVSGKISMPAEEVRTGSAAGATAEPVAPSFPAPVSDRGELLDAFLDGAGMPGLTIADGLTPQFMDMLGQLLRESTQGTLDLLLARTLTKREIRAELTMIAPRENNPLKFSPTVEAALAHLLAPQGRGFMTPLQAMKDAHDDLRSHQFGFMAGMRAALAGVLERFDPRELERRLTEKTVIDTLVPINRKAKLWDLFSERYKEISREAEDDFHALFGKEFLRAYEAQIARLDQDSKYK